MRNGFLKLYFCDFFPAIYKDSSRTSSSQNRQRSLSKEMVSSGNLTFSSELRNFADFIFCVFVISWCRCIAFCLNGVDLSEFVNFHSDIAEIGKKVFVMQIVKRFLIASWNSQCRVNLPYSRTLYKLRITFWIFLHPSFISCLVLNLLPFPEILNIALDQKLSFFSRNFQAWIDYYNIHLFNHRTSYSWNDCWYYPRPLLFYWWYEIWAKNTNDNQYTVI